MRRHVQALNPALVVLFLGMAAAELGGCKPSGESAGYDVASVTRGDLTQYVTASGTLSATISVDVGSQVSGKISVLAVDFNSQVHKGQLIAEIDPTVYEAALHQAEGELASAQATVVLKRQNLARKQTLVPLKAASQLDLDQATAELAQAEASVVIERALQQTAQANLGYCKITSPVDGLVIARKVDVGQTVIAAMTTPVLFTIASDIGQMTISTAVSEADIGQVKENETVEFTVDAFPNETFHGVVKQVRRSPTTTQNVVTYETIISTANPEKKLFPGMTADVTIEVAKRSGALKIPNAALRYSPPEGSRFDAAPPSKVERNQRLVYVPGKNAATLRPVLVKVGITNATETEVVEGLQDGDAVVISTKVAPGSGGFKQPEHPPEGL